VVLDGKHTPIIGTVRTIFSSARLRSRSTVQVLVVRIHLVEFRRAERAGMRGTLIFQTVRVTVKHRDGRSKRREGVQEVNQIQVAGILISEKTVCKTKTRTQRREGGSKLYIPRVPGPKRVRLRSFLQLGPADVGCMSSVHIHCSIIKNALVHPRA
jgi:hypothetical protein